MKYKRKKKPQGNTSKLVLPSSLLVTFTLSEKGSEHPSEHSSKETDSGPAPDSCSIASFTLTADMLSLSSSHSFSSEDEHGREMSIDIEEDSTTEQQEQPSEVVVELVQPLATSPPLHTTSIHDSEKTLSDKGQGIQIDEASSNEMPDKGSHTPPFHSTLFLNSG